MNVYGGPPEDVWVFFAPGRVNLIGEHTDYNGGLVLPAAISLGIYAAVRFDGGDSITFTSLNEPGSVTVPVRGQASFDPSHGWANYPKGVLKCILEERFDLRGCKVLYWADLPVGAGLSSSAALELVTAYLLLYPLVGDSADRIHLATLCRRAENEFVGVECGIMDQFIVAMGKRDSAILLDCATLDYRYVPVRLGDYQLVIMNTAKKRALGESKYNERRAECERCLEVINRGERAAGRARAPGRYRALAHVPLEEAQRYLNDEVLFKRARHVITENKRTLEAARCLPAGSVRRFGRLMIESHESLRDDYEVTGRELDAIVEESLRFEGCVGARMTGAGFGGCAIALVEKGRVEEFLAPVSRSYRARTGLEPYFYTCSIVDGVRCLEPAPVGGGGIRDDESLDNQGDLPVLRSETQRLAGAGERARGGWGFAPGGLG